MKDYMKRETFTQGDGWPWRDIDYGGYSLPRYNEQKRKTKRRARRKMKQEFNREMREYM